MPFYSNYDTLFTTGRAKADVFAFENETKKRLYVNRLDILPDINAAKSGSLELWKEAFAEWESQGPDGQTNALRRYLQYSLADKIPYLESGERLVIVMWSGRDGTTVKCGLALELDFAAALVSAVNLPRDPATLTLLSEDLTLAKRRRFGATDQTTLNFLPFTNVGYSKMLLALNASHDYDPSELYNYAENPPENWFTEIDGSYRGNTGALSRTGDLPVSGALGTGTTEWVYADPDSWAYRNRYGQVFTPDNLTGEYDSVTALFDLNNFDAEERSYSLKFVLPANFDFDVTYSYLTSVRSSRQSRREGFGNRPRRYRNVRTHEFMFRLGGKRLTATKIQTVTIEGYNNAGLTDTPSVIATLNNVTSASRTAAFTTRKRYILLRCKTAYTITVTDYAATEDQNTTWQGSSTTDANNVPSAGAFDGDRDSNRGLATFFNALPTVGSELLPWRVIGYLNEMFPTNLPERYHNFQITEVDHALPPTAAFVIEQFVRTPAQDGGITIALEIQASDGDWYTLLDDIGTISADGKTTLTLSDADFERNIIFSQSDNAMRLAVNTTFPIVLTISITLTN